MTDYTKKKVPRLEVAPLLTKAETDALLGTMLTGKEVRQVLTTDADVYCKETGECLLKFRKGLIPAADVARAYDNLYHAAGQSENRGMAAGKPTSVEEARRLAASQGWILDEQRYRVGMTRLPLLTLDGRKSNVTRALPVLSGIVGYMGEDARFPYCRMTAFTQQHFDKFANAYPIICLVDDVYRQLMPEPYARQRAEADRSSPDFVIKGTAFTTVTVNRNWQTACHTDRGDFTGGFGNLTVLRKGRYEGGLFVLPQYGIGVDMQNTDVLLADVHRVHGNTPIKKLTADATRISLVMYYREGIEKCGRHADELKKARTKLAGRHTAKDTKAPAPAPAKKKAKA
jgi:hypothetical protein